MVKRLAGEIGCLNELRVFILRGLLVVILEVQKTQTQKQIGINRCSSIYYRRRIDETNDNINENNNSNSDINCETAKKLDELENQLLEKANLNKY